MSESVFLQAAAVPRNPSERKEDELIAEIKKHLDDFSVVVTLNKLVAHFRAEIQSRDDMLRRELRLETEKCEHCKLKKKI